MVWPLKRHPAYTSLVNEAGYVDGTRVKQKVQPSSSWRPTLIVVLLLITIATSFYAGQVSVQSRMLSLHIPLDLEPHTFIYNRTFGEAPSALTDHAWNELFPMQGGFFKHPKLAQRRSALSVFHQLHCLNGIREGYWSLYSKATQGHQINEEELPMMSSPPHIRHCIDLLRNALMCQADTTIETKDDELGGVTGFGTEHRCVNWANLQDWVSKWEGYDQDNESARSKKEHHLHETSPE